MKGVALSVLFALGFSGCSHVTPAVDREPYSCIRPSPAANQKIFFTAKVVAIKQSDLHVDFESGGADFASIEVVVTAPEQWRDVREKIYYQDEPKIDGVKLEMGSVFQFEAKSPACLDQPWLFLTDIQGSTNRAH